MWLVTLLTESVSLPMQAQNHALPLSLTIPVWISRLDYWRPIWKFSKAYISSLTSYGLITGLADFSFTERCYWWYLQRRPKPLPKSSSIIGRKARFPRLSSSCFYSFFLLSSFFFKRSYPCPFRAS